MLELFALYLQGGLIDVGFLGAAQIDRFGNINTTVIGDYAHPKTRLPGSGGACEIAINAQQVFVIMRQSQRSFVERIDFRTSPGNLGGAEQAARDPARPGMERAAGRRWSSRTWASTTSTRTARCGWTSSTRAPRSTRCGPPSAGSRRSARRSPMTPAPTAEELRLVREELDPEGVYTK